MDMPALKVILPDEQANNLREMIYALITDTVQTARKDAGLEKQWVNKKDAYKYAGVSYNTLQAWVAQGLPVHVIDGIQLLNKNEIDQFILGH